MKLRLVQMLVLASTAAWPALAGVEDGSRLSEPSGRPTGSETATARASSAGAEVRPLSAIPDFIPLGPPTGAKDELEVKPSGPASTVPEPTTLIVFGVGLLLLFRRRSAS